MDWIGASNQPLASKNFLPQFFAKPNRRTVCRLLAGATIFTAGIPQFHRHQNFGRLRNDEKDSLSSSVTASVGQELRWQMSGHSEIDSAFPQPKRREFTDLQKVRLMSAKLTVTPIAEASVYPTWRFGGSDDKPSLERSGEDDQRGSSQLVNLYSVKYGGLKPQSLRNGMTGATGAGSLPTKFNFRVW